MKVKQRLGAVQAWKSPNTMKTEGNLLSWNGPFFPMDNREKTAWVWELDGSLASVFILWFWCERDQDMPPPNRALWHKDYLELKAIKTQQMHPLISLWHDINCPLRNWHEYCPSPVPGCEEWLSTKMSLHEWPLLKSLIFHRFLHASPSHFLRFIVPWSPNPLSFVKKVIWSPKSASLSFISFLWTPLQINMLINVCSLSPVSQSLSVD